MSIFKKYFHPIALISTLMMTVLISGCSSTGSSNPVSSTSSSTLISNYSLAGVTGVIDEATKSIAITVPFDTNVTALVATFTTEGATINVGTTLQTSGVTPNNFTTPVEYIVTAGDGSTATYTVRVTVASSTAKAITAYSINGIAGTINETAKTIAVTVPNGTNVTALVAKFNTTGSSVKVGTTVQTSGVTANNFTTPVIYTVTSGDTLTTANYTVTVTVASSTAKAITAYSFAGYPGATGVINETAKTIAVTVPYGTNVTALVATFTTTGTSVKVGTTVQISAVTANNFTSAVDYIVTAADNLSTTYKVTVTKAESTAKAITAYSFAGQPDSIGVIDETAKTIAVSVLPGTDLTARVATFTTTGTSVKVNGVTQVSGTTSNDFTNSVVYTVAATDASTADYNVTVTPGSGPVPIDLGTAGNFAILTKAGISTTVGTAIVGDMGVSPAATSYITGFGTLTAGATYETSPLVTGKIYAADMIPPTPAYMTTAIGDMEIAYNAAAGRAAGVGANLNLGAGTLLGQTLAPGTYTWGGDVTITTDLTLNGGVNDVWIFQIGNKLDLNSNSIILTGGAQAKNIFWQVAGVVTLGTNSHFEGIILAKTNIAVLTGASANARLLAQTAVTLQSNAITQP